MKLPGDLRCVCEKCVRRLQNQCDGCFVGTHPEKCNQMSMCRAEDKEARI